MKVKELIKILVDCPMDDEIELEVPTQTKYDFSVSDEMIVLSDNGKTIISGVVEL